AAAAYDQYQMGREVGKIVIRILQGEGASTIPVATPNQVKTVVNLKTAKSLGIHIPDTLRSTISKVIGE
ncbi:MAG TPA: ABC transporter substrate binding protein, partial [Candidatus Nitrosotenuis sp.]|nr:ABC transporter substrate binding protein [Candidatus Nitrosotenuis sp.]